MEKGIAFVCGSRSQQRCSLTVSRWQNVITGCRKDSLPFEGGGGILADVMCLRKTLTMISAIVATADQAKEFADQVFKGDHLNVGCSFIPSRATLVMVLSPCKVLCRNHSNT